MPADNLVDEAKKLAIKISRKSLPVLMLAKDAFNYGINVDLDSALQFEIECFSHCFGMEDHNEGMLALIEKRSPSFQDK